MELPPSTPDRRWSFESARAMLPEVRDRTAEAVPAVEKLLAEREALDAGSEDRAQIEARIATVTVEDWIAATWAQILGANRKP